jgi:NADH-quinone oxidoreductase subunit L
MTAANARPAPYHFHWDVATIGTAAGLIGIVVSWLIYQRRVVEPARVAKALGPIYSLAVNKFYFDVAYQFLVKKVQQGVAVAMNWIEQVVLIKGIVNNVAGGTREAGNRLRRFQTGRLPGYVFIIAAGVVLVVFISVVARTGS